MTDVRSIDELFSADAPHSVTAVVPIAKRARLQVLWLYSLTIFLSAFLLFQIEPLIGKLILPWFGGTAGVWSACMLVFQVLLFGGYAYVHFTTTRFSPRKQAVIHTLVLAAACATLPILPRETWKPTGEEDPVTRIVLLLGITVGPPFFALSATGPLLQAWFSRMHADHSPYRLYALSNVGSLLALITYPAVFEWVFASRALANLWSWAFAGFAVLCGICAYRAAKHRPLPITVQDEEAALSRDDPPPPSAGTRLLWFALAMVPSVLLLAITNQVCLDVASVPFLWVLPLTLYLLSFILCFDNDRWYFRRFLMPAAGLSLAWIYPVLRSDRDHSVAFEVAVYFTSFFLCAMVCHGELARRRPHVRHLTSFYLLMAAGGAAGGIFVGLVSPRIFRNYYELHLGLFGCATLMLVVLYTDRQSSLFHGKPRAVWAALCLAVGLFTAGLIYDASETRSGVIDADRNFYGVLRARTGFAPFGDSLQPIDQLLNGHIVHGTQYQDPQLRRVPTAYYCPASGIGRILLQPTRGNSRRVGVIGLGIGTLAAYAKPGDRYRFYEINPIVERMARAHFHYLADCPGEVDVVFGDARLTLEREAPQNFDVLVLDAFSGDAIPVHLLTVEAFAVYLGHLAPDGIIAVHISNLHFGLGPVVDAIAHEHGLTYAAINAPEPSSTAAQHGGTMSLWVLASRNPAVLDRKEIRGAALQTNGQRVLWTDDHASLFDVLLN